MTSVPAGETPYSEPDSDDIGPVSPSAAEPDGEWICPHCHRGRCHRCTSRDCRCCAGAPDDPA